jgi:hypothetical protein
MQSFDGSDVYVGRNKLRVCGDGLIKAVQAVLWACLCLQTAKLILGLCKLWICGDDLLKQVFGSVRVVTEGLCSEPAAEASSPLNTIRRGLHGREALSSRPSSE